jgi:Protein of unknown function (DUF3108)
MKIAIFVLLFLCFSLSSFVFFNPTEKRLPFEKTEGFCGIKNNSFKSGEQLTFDGFYAVAGAYISAGNATITCVQEKLNGKETYHIEGVGNSNTRYDFIYKVRDKYESWLDTATFLPIKFKRKVNEGKRSMDELISFNHINKTASSTKKKYNILSCTQDGLGAIYYARNLNFNSFTIGEKINFNMAIDDNTHNSYIKYLGKEKIKTSYGTFNAIKLKILTIKGTIFQGGEQISIWISDDANHIPIRIESSISIGTIKIDMIRTKNLRFPLSSLIKN